MPRLLSAVPERREEVDQQWDPEGEAQEEHHDVPEKGSPESDGLINFGGVANRDADGHHSERLAACPADEDHVVQDADQPECAACWPKISRMKDGHVVAG